MGYLRRVAEEAELPVDACPSNIPSTRGSKEIRQLWP